MSVSIKKQIVSLIFSVALWVNICSSQSSSIINATNWGDSVDGVQMSIRLNTNVVIIGSVATLQCQIENSSTNPIYALISSRVITATLSLTNNSGEIYNLTPTPKFQIPPPITGYFYDVVNAKEVYAWPVPFKVDKTVEAGDYELIAQRYFRLTPDPKEAYKLVSNSLKIMVIK